MTKTQYRGYNRLAKKQVNRQHDIAIVEDTDRHVTLFVAFPGLYLTYDPGGKLLATESPAERAAGNGSLAVLTQERLRFVSSSMEVGSADYGQSSCPVVNDEDVPF